MTDERSDYLWDGRGEADPEVAHLEAVLGRAASSRRRCPALPPRVPASGAPRPADCGVRADRGRQPSSSWPAPAGSRSGSGSSGGSWSGSPGSRSIDGKALDARRPSCGAAPGWRPASGGKARVRVGEIGLVDVDPDTRLQLVSPRGREHRMSLEQGTIHALIWAPPKAFVVDTPSAVATDLGCAYTLKVDEAGAGLVRVTAGGSGSSSRRPRIVHPAGCRLPDPARRRPRDAVLRGRARRLCRGAHAPRLRRARWSRRRAAALDTVLSTARRKDALTLWHLLTRGTHRGAPAGLCAHGGARAAARRRHARGRAAPRSPGHRPLVERARPRRRVVVADLDAGVGWEVGVGSRESAVGRVGRWQMARSADGRSADGSIATWHCATASRRPCFADCQELNDEPASVSSCWPGSVCCVASS